jgi:hypothetical protein
VHAAQYGEAQDLGLGWLKSLSRLMAIRRCVPPPLKMGLLTWALRALLADASASKAFSCPTCVIEVAKPAGSCSSMRFCEQGE